MTTHVDSQVRTTFSREERDSTLESHQGVYWSLEIRLFIWKPVRGQLAICAYLLCMYVRQDML